jgi:Flp pilus assembly pilin Flp
MNIRNALWYLRSRFAGLHRDEQGDEGVNKVLIIALIAVPLIIVMIIFGREIAAWFDTAWSNIKGEDAIKTGQGGST